MKKPYLLVGEIVKPHGIRGEVKVRHYTNDPERFEELKHVFLEKNGEYTPLNILACRLQQDDVYMTLEHVVSRDDAEKLRGEKLWIDRAHAVHCDTDEYFIADLLGSEAFDTKGKKIGVLKDVFPGGDVDVFSFQTDQGTMMTPALKTVLLSMDVEAGTIVIDEERLKEVCIYENNRS